jgi:hypothetical protein
VTSSCCLEVSILARAEARALRVFGTVANTERKDLNLANFKGIIMSHVTFNTLKFVETLKESGIEEKQAKGIATAYQNASDDQ